MKQRAGFVSNSSSSSFIILGKTASIDEIDDDDIILSGEFWGESSFVCPDQDLKDYLKENGLADQWFSLTHAYIIFDAESSESPITKEQIDIINSKYKTGLSVFGYNSVQNANNSMSLEEYKESQGEED